MGMGELFPAPARVGMPSNHLLILYVIISPPWPPVESSPYMEHALHGQQRSSTVSPRASVSPSPLTPEPLRALLYHPTPNPLFLLSSFPLPTSPSKVCHFTPCSVENVKHTFPDHRLMALQNQGPPDRPMLPQHGSQEVHRFRQRVGRRLLGKDRPWVTWKDSARAIVLSSC